MVNNGVIVDGGVNLVILVDNNVSLIVDMVLIEVGVSLILNGVLFFFSS